MLLNKIVSVAFRFVFFFMIAINYLYFVIYTWLPICKENSLGYIVLFIYHFFLIMLLWTLIITNTSDPGQVPLYWGFFFGDSDNKRRRYCLMCNVFKPDRCHHCSICNRCVLNMDHHCPWINNCIGFYNRKFFIQMLFYINVLLVYSALVNFKFTYDIIRRIIFARVNIRTELNNSLAFLFMYTADIVVLVVLGLFFKFHLNLVLDNKTTIETIDKKGEEFESLVKKYFNI